MAPVAPGLELAEEAPQIPVFLFVNPKSGGNQASALLSPKAPNSRVPLPTLNRSAKIRVFDISDGPAGAKPGFLDLRAAAATAGKDDPVRVVVAGGDGTVMWCLSEMDAHAVDLDAVAVGVMPFGTGNDFARALEWSMPSSLNLYDDDCKLLKPLLEQWVSATTIVHDLWTVEISCRRAGAFLKVEDGKKTEILDAEGRQKKIMKYAMSNYFSIGVESRIGVGFDKNRTNSAFKNKLVYTHEGMKKTFFTATLSTNETLHHLAAKGVPVFTSEPSQHPLLKPCASLIAVNIPSFCAGLDVWGKAKASGLEGQAGLNEELSTVQRMGDGLLEWVSFASAASIGMEVTDPGHARRLHCGAGPFTISFNDTIGDKKVYFQVDGEFFVVRAPKTATVSFSKQIKVLANPQSRKQKHYIRAKPVF